MEAVLTHRLRLRLPAALALATITGAAAAASTTFSVEIAGGRAKGNDTLKVRKGDQVQVRISSDQPVVLHLHGYDIDLKVAPPAAATMTFKADVAGRFPVHEHRHGPGSHRAVLFIEVHP
jgi:FtsP/CotA-like multicopper oxidase with cupredoxin domain